jgi:hypothetical protein
MDPSLDSVNPVAGRRAAVVDPAVDAGAVVDDRERAARAAASRRRTLFALIAAAVVALGVVGFFALRDTASPCAEWLGDPAEVSHDAGGKPVKPRFSANARYGCHESYAIGDKVGDGVALSTEARGPQIFAARRRDEDHRAYADKVTLALPGQGGDAYLFVAGAQAEPSTAAMQADAMARVGHSADPMGDMLESLPPGQHVALFLAGDDLVTLRMDRDAFTADAAKALTFDVARRARASD